MTSSALDAPDEYGDTPLYSAAVQGDLGEVRRLLDAGADPNVECEHGTALCAAASWGYDAVVSELVNRGADPNLPESDELGFTPLVSAAHNGHTETARILLENGADANLAAPIVYASRRGSLELVRALLQHGARPDPKAIHQAEKLAGADIDAHLRELARPAASDTVTIVREAKDDGTEIVRAHVARGPDVSSELTLETGHAAIAELLRSAQTA